ncbi:hypothetical protein MMC25_001679 [Agyrium rufum]|nr:hypothetical protein [Agyrium rufum]
MMKRKLFSNPLKSGSSNDVSRIHTDDQLSPPRTPVSSTGTRQILSAEILAQLHEACSLIVRESAPAGPDFDDLFRHQMKAMKEPARRQHDAEPKPGAEPDSLHHRRTRREHADNQPAPRIHVARDVRPGPESSGSRLSTGRHFEPLEPTVTRVSNASTRIKSPVPNAEDPLLFIRSQMDVRPKTSAAACIDYQGPSTGTSTSTTRTNTTYDLRPSTGLTSMADTPARIKSVSSNRDKTSQQILGSPDAAVSADAAARNWMAMELARRRSVSTGRPESRMGRESIQRPQSRSSFRESSLSRPQSRAGSIAEGIMDYIRPRTSIDSMRSVHTNASGQPSLSRGGSWWRGTRSVKRKGSWSSFRSAKPEDMENERSSRGDRGPDLNRSLPPLPGLDQYQEKKPQPMHIAQLMRPGAGDRNKTFPTATITSNARPALQVQTSSTTNARSMKSPGIDVIGYNGKRRTLSQSQERERQHDLNRCVEEKMRLGAISPPQSPQNRPKHMRDASLGDSLSALSIGPTIRSGSKDGNAVIKIQEMGGRKKLSKDKEKSGLKKRFSAIFGSKKGNTVSAR